MTHSGPSLAPGALNAPISASRGRGAASLFPDEDGGGLALSQERIKALSRAYSALYLRLLGELVPGGARALGVPERALAVAWREGLVGPIHVFLDRLLRLEEFGRGSDAPAVEAAPPARDCDDAAELKALAQGSLAFNAGLLAEHAALLGWPTAGAAATQDAEPWAESGRNNNFIGVTFAAKLKRKLLEALPRTRGRRLPCLSLAYATSALRSEGFLRRRLEHVSGRLEASAAPRDAALRARLLTEPVAACAAIDEFLASAGWRGPAQHVRNALGSWLSRQCPSPYLEGLAGNLERGRAVLSPFAPRPLLLAEVSSLEATVLMAAAHSLKMPVVGLQHGGHYGYMEDHTVVLELEYPYYDRFVSWGWDRMPEWEVCRRVAVTALPCPWLAERREYWRRSLPAARRDPNGKPHSILLLTNKVYRFPPAPSGAAIARADRAPDMRALLKSLVREAAGRGLSILHKPYNPGTVSQLKGTLGDLASAGGALYRELPAVDKGLTPALLSDCGVVVWDQPGTGFIECLASGLPTLCLWPRHYNEEEPRWRALFGELEAAGLVHRTPAGLCEEVLRFQADPRAWTADPRRREAAESFCRSLGRVDPDWAAQWERFLDGLSQGDRS